MVAYSFRARFIDPIVAGTKTQTIRAPRKSWHVRAGGKMQLYSAMRTKHCRAIGTATCLMVSPITIKFGDGLVSCGDELIYTKPALDAFAVRDGFQSWADMKNYWHLLHKNTPQSEFDGFLIIWTDFESALAE